MSEELKNIYMMLGPSASGKNELYNKIMSKNLSFIAPYIPYTTRPMRENEKDSVDYFFKREKDIIQYKEQNTLIELREYKTIHGIWKYFTVFDWQFKNKSLLIIGTLDSFNKTKSYFSKINKNINIIPIYIYVDDETRLYRAIKRELEEKTPKIKELCRRFVADAKDFSNDNLKKAQIHTKFVNTDLDICAENIVSYILSIENCS